MSANERTAGGCPHCEGVTAENDWLRVENARLRVEVRRLREVLDGTAPAEGSWQTEALALRAELTTLRARDEAAKAVVREWTTWSPSTGTALRNVLDALARVHEDEPEAG